MYTMAKRTTFDQTFRRCIRAVISLSPAWMAGWLDEGRCCGLVSLWVSLNSSDPIFSVDNLTWDLIQADSIYCVSPSPLTSAHER